MTSNKSQPSTSIATLPADIGSLVFEHLHACESTSKALTCTTFHNFSNLSLKRRAVVYASGVSARQLQDGFCIDGTVYTCGRRTRVDAEAYAVPSASSDVQYFRFECDKQCVGGCSGARPIDRLLQRCPHVEKIFRRSTPNKSRQEFVEEELELVVTCTVQPQTIDLEVQYFRFGCDKRCVGKGFGVSPIDRLLKQCLHAEIIFWCSMPTKECQQLEQGAVGLSRRYDELCIFLSTFVRMQCYNLGSLIATEITHNGHESTGATGFPRGYNELCIFRSTFVRMRCYNLGSLTVADLTQTDLPLLSNFPSLKSLDMHVVRTLELGALPSICNGLRTFSARGRQATFKHATETFPNLKEFSLMSTCGSLYEALSGDLLPPNLELLSFDSLALSSEVETDLFFRCCEAISTKLPVLRGLVLRMSYMVPDSYFQALVKVIENLPHLSSLDTSLPSSTHTAIDCIQAPRLPSLKTLKLCVGLRLVESASLFDACTNLTHLSITQSSHSPLTEALFTLGGLQRLELCRCSITASQADIFSTFARLRRLQLMDVIVDNSVSRRFAQALSHTALEYMSVRGELTVHAASYLSEVLDVVPLRFLDVFLEASRSDDAQDYCALLRQKCVNSPHMVSFRINST